MHRWLVRALACAGGAVAAVVGAAAPASAHPVHYGDDPSNWRSSVTSVQPSTAGLVVSLGDGAQRLQVSAQGSVEVVVIGYAGEPFVRVTARGVWLNQKSPTTWAVAGPTVPQPSDVDAAAAPRWKRTSTSGTFVWHDTRTHWPGYALPAPVEAHPDRAQQVLTWVVPLVVDGRRGVIAGTLDWVPGPDPVPGAVVAVSALLAAGCIGLLRRWRAALVVAVGVLVATDVAHVTAGVLGRVGSTWARLGAVPGHGVISLLVWIALAACAAESLRRRGLGPLYAAAMLVAVVFLVDAAPSLAIVWRSQATTDLPIDVDRYVVAALTGTSAGLLVAATVLLRKLPGGNEC